jgi:hypothetical protein
MNQISLSFFAHINGCPPASLEVVPDAWMAKRFHECPQISFGVRAIASEVRLLDELCQWSQYPKLWTSSGKLIKINPELSRKCESQNNNWENKSRSNPFPPIPFDVTDSKMR